LLIIIQSAEFQFRNSVDFFHVIQGTSDIWVA